MRDDVVTIETTAGDLDIADPDEVSQYERWGELLQKHATTDLADIR